MRKFQPKWNKYRITFSSRVVSSFESTIFPCHGLACCLALLLEAPKNSQAGPTSSLLLEKPFSALQSPICSSSSSPQRPMTFLCFFSYSKPRGWLLQPLPFQCHLCTYVSILVAISCHNLYTKNPQAASTDSFSQVLCFKTPPENPAAYFPVFPEWWHWKWKFDFVLEGRARKGHIHSPHWPIIFH